MTEPASSPNRSPLQYSLVSQAAILDGIQLSSIIVPTGLIIHQVRNAFKPSVPVATSVQSTPSSTGSSSLVGFRPISSLNHQLVNFLKLNGIWTFGLGLAFATAITAVSSLTQTQKSIPTLNLLKSTDKKLKYRSNDYSIIGGTLGGLITTTIFWKRSFINLFKIIPGGIGIGVATGLSTAYFQAIRTNIDDTKQSLSNSSS